MAETQIVMEPEVKATARAWRWHYALLVMIVILGAGLRFAWLDRPALWGDEAATWARTCGTFEQMLKGNQQDGFVPLHYELYWWLNQRWPMDAWRMRLVPAIAGTLMVPAMYFLARQLVRPRGALLVALLTATSAFYLNYSRDAKMYMPAWLFVTLHLACVLWWLRGGGWAGRGVAWWCWVAAGVAAVGYHASVWLVVPIGFLAVLTHGRPRVWRLLAYPLGVAIIAAGPVYYYTNYNTWLERSGGLVPRESTEASGNWGQSGIAWIEVQTRRKTGMQLVRDSASAYLFGYSRAEEQVDREGNVPIALAVLNAVWGAMAGVALVLVVGAVTWPRWRRRAKSEEGDVEARLPAEVRAEPWRAWQLLLWLSAWVVLPTYAFFYCRSVQAPASPMDWLSGAWALFGWHWVWVALAAAVLAVMACRWRRMQVALAWVLGLWLAVVVGLAIARGGWEWYVWLMWLAGVRPVLGALLAVGVAVTWSSAQGTQKQRVMRLLAGVLVAAVVLGMAQVGWQVWAHLRQVAEAAGKPLQSIWMPRYLAVIVPGVMVVLVIAILRLPGRVLPTLAVLAIVAANLVQYGARLYMDPEPRTDLGARDLLAADEDETKVVYVRDSWPMGAPGSGGLYDLSTRFYLASMLGPGNFDPTQVRNGSVERMLKDGLHRMHSVRWVLNDLRRRPNVEEMVIWQKTSMVREGEMQTLEAGLGEQWELVDTWSRKTWRHWNWQEMDEMQRLEYRRVEGPGR